MKRVFLSILLASILILTTAGYGLVRADELEDINKKLDELQKSLDSSQKATATNEQQLAGLNQQLNNIKAQVTKIENDIVQKEKDIKVGEEKLAAQKELLDQRVASFYKQKGRSKDALLEILVSDSFTEFLKQFTYQQNLLDDDRKAIVRVVLLVKDIEEKKEILESEKERLIPIKQAIDEQSEFLEGEVISAKKHQETLKGEIASLSARQKEIMAARSGNFIFSIGSGELADEYLSSIKGFRESAPSGYFAIFSFGAYTHRNGMSQYGAKARAEANQSYSDILKKYYPDANIETKGDLPTEINVEGFGMMPFEDRYLMGISEMPSSWHPEALKAQAIAARTYAFAKKDTPNGICTNEYCQVFLSSKADNPPQAWKDAVKATTGQVLIKDGSPAPTQYSSTAGGFLNSTGWDTTDGGGGSNFIDKAYEKLAGSPWLYKAWWRQHYSNNGDTCGRSNPWLSPEEMADIVNAAVALKTGGIDTSRITPVTTSCWGGNPYSMDELRNLVSGKGGISSANSVTVTQGNGITNSVSINGVSLSGSEFKRAVCLRAPGYIRIPQGNCEEGSWAFFNIEKK